MHSGLHITYKNEISGETLEFSNTGGLPAFLTKLVTDAQKPAVTEVAFSAVRETGDKIEVSLQWTESTEETYRTYANGIRTPHGGTHENGLKTAIRKAINNYIETHDIKVKGLKITADDIREGVVAVLSVFLRDPMFESQTKNSLTNPEMESTVDGFVRPALEAWLNNNKTAADAIVGRIVIAARMREASRAAKEEVKRKSPGSKRLSLPGKSRRLQINRRFEDGTVHCGRRLGRRIGEARARQQHASRVAASRKDSQHRRAGHCEVLTNQEISDLVTAIGTGAGEKFNYDNLRYGKIILLMDADADGCHIATLMLDFLFRLMQELIKEGARVPPAQPPLYRVNVGKDTPLGTRRQAQGGNRRRVAGEREEWK